MPVRVGLGGIVANIVGTEFNDILTGTAGTDNIDGSGGDDIIDASGDDVVFGSYGDDRLLFGRIGPVSQFYADGGDGYDVLAIYIGQAVSNGVFSLAGMLAAGAVIKNVESVAIQGTWNNERIYGSSWDETIYGGQGTDELYGGAGNDVLWDDGGLNKFWGEAGNDTLIVNLSRNDMVFYADGGDGTDNLHINLLDAATPYVFSVSNMLTSGSTAASIESFWIDGSSNDDVIIGSDLNDTISGAAGDDQLHGGAGNDHLDGQGGSDSLFGNDGDDELFLSLADSTTTMHVEGGRGNDLLIISLGGDQLDTRALEFSIQRALDNSSLSHDIERIWINGNGGDNVLTGSAGSDTIYGLAGNDHILGGAGGDFLSGWEGDDYISGGDGDDVLSGDAGEDTLLGEGGNDQLYVRLADSSALFHVDGGVGTDFLSLGFDYGSTGVNFDLSSSLVGGASLVNIENIILTGSSSDDHLSAGDWRADITGGEGNDVLYAGLGLNYLTGGDGADRFVFRHASESSSRLPDIISDFTSGIDVIDLSGFAVWKLEVVSVNSLYSINGIGIEGSFSVLVSGSLALSDINYTQTGLYRNGTSNSELIVGAQLSDYLRGNEGADELSGSGGDDTLDGGLGGDSLDGGAGYDTIYAAEGDDSITGLADGDTIDGGSGHDTVTYDGLAYGYVISAGSMRATVSSDVTRTDHISTVEDIQFRDATLTFDADSNAAFVMRLYDGAFDRLPETLGLDYWVDQMNANVSKSTIANIFLQSPEFATASGTLSTSDFVHFLYAEVLGRAPEAGATAYWTSQIETGMSRGDALLAFSESAEHRAATASTLANGLWVTDNDYQQVAALYDAFAGRLPDLGGLNYWVGQVKGGMSIEQVADSFVKSQEFFENTNGFSSSQLVDFIYESALDRPAEAGGKAYWAQQLDAGLSKGDLLLNIGLSAEHFQLLEHQLFSGVNYLM